MKHIHQHSTHRQHEHGAVAEKRGNNFHLAINTTIHCLIGCGIGEVVGMIIATYWDLSMANSLLLSIALGFVFGFALGIVPFVRNGLSLSKSFKIVLVGEGLSIVVMETFEVLTQLLIPGLMAATLYDGSFWIGMLASLIVGFLAAFPVNYYMINRGFRHHH